MEFSEFQRAARDTSQLRKGGPQGVVAPLLGLASETGSILNVYKKYLRDGIDLTASREFLREELGDLLWYTAVVASACDLELEDIVQANLHRTQHRYGQQSKAHNIHDLPIFDANYPERERFPRRLTIEFVEQLRNSGRLIAQMKLINAEPNAFPDGPLKVTTDKYIGFQIDADLGDELTDNSRRSDAYRFHDAIHLGFMAVLGWSPNLRSLLRVKRKSNRDTDEVEDGARAIFAEEGLAAVLSRLATRRTGFLREANVDGEVIDVAQAATSNLEVDVMPGWLWRRAINHGFSAMHNLAANSGGYLIADLDARVLTYEKVLS